MAAVRTVLSALTAVACLLLAVAIVAVWRIGPVVLVLSRTHGVHAGDALAALPAAATVALAARLVNRRRNGERPPRA